MVRDPHFGDILAHRIGSFGDGVYGIGVDFGSLGVLDLLRHPQAPCACGFNTKRLQNYVPT